MADFKQIKNLLSDIVDSGYQILDELESEELDLKKARSLMKQRGEEIKKLDEISLGDADFSDPERKELKNLFTRFTVLEKHMNIILSKLSLLSKTSLQEVALHKKAKKSYRTPFKTSKFLNTRVSG